MTSAELAEATKEFDRPLPSSRFRALTKAERAEWERAKRAGARGREIMKTLDLDPQLMSEAVSYARQMKISIHEVIELGIKKLIRGKRA